MVDWDDYRYVLAIARAGGLTGAADALGVTLSTVYRRLEKIEAAEETRLFDRRRGNYALTAAGRQMADAAERMESEALAADRGVAGLDRRLSGTVRLTATELFAAAFLPRHLPRFAAEHPGLEIEVHAENRRLSLADREADLTLRVGRPSEADLYGRRIGTMRWGIYGAARGGKRKPPETLADFATLPFVGWHGQAPSGVIGAWTQSHMPGVRTLCSTSSLLANAAFARTGAAVAVLPCLLGDITPGLRALTRPLPDLEAGIWLLTHEDMRLNARIETAMAFLVDAAEADRELWEGTE